MSSLAGVWLRAGSRSSLLAWARDRAWAIAVWAAMLAWATALFLLMRGLYGDVKLARYDLGNMVQAVWSTAHGRPLEVTDGVTGEQMIRLGSHVDPILALLAPLWVVAPSPLTLVAAQIVAVALGALAVFWLGRRHLGSERLAALLALAYLAYPWTAWVAVDGFHPVTLAIPFVLFAVYFLDGDRLWPFALCAAGAALTGELVGLWIAALGVWYAVGRGRRAAGLVVGAAGLAWTFLALRVVVPAFSGASSGFYGVYADVGGSPWGVVRTAVTDPSAIVSAATRQGDLFYLAMLVAPLAGAFLLAPGLAAVALPQLAANLLAGFDATTDPRAHYVAGIVPFLFAALAVGLGRLSPSARGRCVLLVVTLSAVFSVILGPWPGGPGRSYASYWGEDSPAHERALRRAVALVPAGVPVSATNRLGSRLAARRYAYTAPVVGRAEWLVLDSEDAWRPAAVGGGPDPDALAALVARIRDDARWSTVFESDGVYVFRRAGP